MTPSRPAASAELEHYLQALWGRHFRVSFGTAAIERSAFDDCEQLLPPLVDADPNGNLLARARAAHAAAHAVFSGPRFDVGSLKPLQQVLVALFEDARVEALAIQHFPGLRRLWAPFHVATPAPVASCDALLARLSRALFDERYVDPDAWIEKARRAFRAGGAGPEHSRQLGSLLGNDLGQMRLPFDARQYRVEPAYRDDHGGLWERPPAPAKAVSPSASSAPSSATELPSGATSHVYPEWDYVIARERPAFCRLRDETAASSPDLTAPAPALVRRWRRRLQSALVEVSVERRSSDGPLLDLAAVVDAAADRIARRSAPLRIYQRPRRRARRASLLVLLDLSASSHAHRELSRSGAQLLCAAAPTTLELAVDGFSSYGRHDVRYTRFKDFTEPAAVAGSRLGQLSAAGSTRLGAAVRHAHWRLNARAPREKLLLVVSDGEPADVDIFDDRYLVEDARCAVKAARRAGIKVLGGCLPGGSEPLQQRIFGPWRARLTRLEDLLCIAYPNPKEHHGHVNQGRR